jgi:hypothetical protein
MYEISEYVNRKRKLSTAILRYPTGRYGLVGSMPIELTVEVKHPLSWPPPRESLVWDTEQEAIDALLSIGITEFQLSNCQWYQP